MAGQHCTAPEGDAAMWRRWYVVTAAVCLTTAMVVSACGGVQTSLTQQRALLSADALNTGLGRAAPGDKGRGGGHGESKIERETMAVIKAADSARRPAEQHSPRETVQVPHLRSSVSVLHAHVEAPPAAASSKQNPVKSWNWKEWQEQEAKALSLSSTLPTSASNLAAADEKIAEKAAAVRIAAAKVAAQKIAAATAASKIHRNVQTASASKALAHGQKPAVAAKSSRLVPRKQIPPTPEASETAAPTVPERKVAIVADGTVAQKKAFIHAAARARSQANAVRKGIGGKKPTVAAQVTSQATAKGSPESQWNWAQWQEEAKKLLLHPEAAAQSDSEGKGSTSTSHSASAAVKERSKTPLSEAPGAKQESDSAASKLVSMTTAQKQAKMAQRLQSQVNALELVQHNTEALSKVEAQDATIKSEITSVMKHVKQLDKGKNKFTEVAGKVVASSLSKSTLKAMKEAQKAGWAADNAAKKRAQAEAAAQYAKVRDEMFLKDAEKAAKDEQQLRAEKKAARDGVLKRYGGAMTSDNARLLHALNKLNRKDEATRHLDASSEAAKAAAAAAHAHTSAARAVVAARSATQKVAARAAGTHVTRAQKPTSSWGFFEHLFG